MMLAKIVAAAGLLTLIQEAKQPPTAPPPAPNSIVIIACRVDDLTGQEGRQDPAMAAQGWKDLELHIENGEYECKREVIANIVDQAAQIQPSLKEMHPDMGDIGTCAHVSMTFVPDWEKHHPGWGVVGVGCPVKITNGGPAGPVISWKLPECPAHLPGHDDAPMKCNYDDSAI